MVCRLARWPELWIIKVHKNTNFKTCISNRLKFWLTPKHSSTVFLLHRLNSLKTYNRQINFDVVQKLQLLKQNVRHIGDEA